MSVVARIKSVFPEKLHNFRSWGAINELELLAVKFSPQSFEPQLFGNNLRILSVNTKAVSYIKSKGGTKSPACNDMAGEI